MRYVLEIEGLSKHYDGFDLQVVNIAVEPGHVVGLIGSNGAGKTTTIKAVLKMIEPDDGRIRLFGEEPAQGKELPNSVKARIGVVLDSCAFPAGYKVKDVATLGKTAYPTWDQRKWASLIERFALPPNKRTTELSRGMGMKLSLAFALSHDPELLILDEATAGLDPIARDEVLDILREFMMDETRGILISSHITSDLEKIADEIVCLDNGKVIFSLEKDAITDEAGIARIREEDIRAIAESPMFGEGTMRILRHEHWVDLLVPDRFAFQREFPEAVVDKASIEEHMALMLKGEAL